MNCPWPHLWLWRGVAWHGMAVAWHGMAIDGNAAGTTLACIQMFRSFYVQTFAHMYACTGCAPCACHHRSCLSASLHSQPRAKVLTFSRCCLCQGGATLRRCAQLLIYGIYVRVCMCMCVFIYSAYKVVLVM